MVINCKHVYMNTVFTIWWALWWSGTTFCWITINTSFYLIWMIRMLRWMWWCWWCRDSMLLLGWILFVLFSLNINHFTIAMITSDWIVIFVCVARIRAQGWTWYIIRFVIHLKMVRNNQKINKQTLDTSIILRHRLTVFFLSDEIPWKTL